MRCERVQNTPVYIYIVLQAVKDKQLVLHKVNSALQRRMAQAQRTQAVM